MIFIKSWEYKNLFKKYFFGSLSGTYDSELILIFYALHSFAYEVTDQPSLGPAIGMLLWINLVFFLIEV